MALKGQVVIFIGCSGSSVAAAAPEPRARVTLLAHPRHCQPHASELPSHVPRGGVAEKMALALVCQAAITNCRRLGA